MKSIILLTCLFVITSMNLKAQETEVTLFAQGIFNIPSAEELSIVEESIKSNPNVNMVRLDASHNLFIIFTKNINELSEIELRKWFGKYGELLTCVQIGINNVDQRNAFPFTNCKD